VTGVAAWSLFSAAASLPDEGEGAEALVLCGVVSCSLPLWLCIIRDSSALSWFISVLTSWLRVSPGLDCPSVGVEEALVSGAPKLTLCPEPGVANCTAPPEAACREKSAEVQASSAAGAPGHPVPGR